MQVLYTVTQAAVEAAINFVEVCCQHTVYIAGCININEQLELFETDMVCIVCKDLWFTCTSTIMFMPIDTNIKCSFINKMYWKALYNIKYIHYIAGVHCPVWHNHR